MNSNKYIITTGWWCGPDSGVNNQRTKYGSENIRTLGFFEKWYAAVNRFSNPVKILIVDSASESLPSILFDKRLELISLDENSGHSTSHIGKYAGVTRAHICGMIYAMCCNVDYWVYIEQDALIYGNGIVEYAISKLKNDIMFGDGHGTPQPMQQSFMIMKTSAIPAFIYNFTKINKTDAEISPEMKFWMASTGLSKSLPIDAYCDSTPKSIIFEIIRLYWKPTFDFRKINKLAKSKNRFPIKSIKPIKNYITDTYHGYDLLPFGYGRARPINFTDKYLYFQHGSFEELKCYDELFNKPL